MKTTIHHLIAITVLLSGAVSAQTSVVPEQISYQGIVTDSGGTPVGNSTPENRTVIFRVWDHATNSAAANLIYSEQQVVTINKGEFSVLVGDGTATTGNPLGHSPNENTKKLANLSSAFNGSTRFLGVTVYDAGNVVTPEISPRQRIVSSSFAHRAKFAESVGANGTTAITTLNDGKVGVGTVSPPALLTVTGANTSLTTNTPQFVITDTGDINERLLFGVDSTGNGTGFIQATKVGTGAQNLLLNPNGGNVGIGMTSAPTSRLDVNGGIKATGAGGFTFNTGDTNGGLFSPAVGTVTLQTNGTERLRVNSSGNVGIGLSSAHRLGINGNVFIGSSATTAFTTLADSLYLGSPRKYLSTTLGASVDGSVDWMNLMFHPLSAGLMIGTSGADATPHAGISPLMVIRPSGDVGIGTSAPTSRLDVNGGIKATGEGGFTFNSGDADGGLFSPADGTLTLRTNGTERLRVDPSGNVGIGTTSPAQKLEVVGNAYLATSDNAALVVDNSGNGRFGIVKRAGFDPVIAAGSGSSIIFSQSNQANLFSNIGTSSLTERMRIASNGNLGIGTSTPTSKLTVRTSSDYGITHTDGTTTLATYLNSSGGWLGTTSAHSLLFYTGGGGAQMALTTGGRVGIGTLSPVCPLDVRGGEFVVINGNYTTIKSEWYVQSFGYGTISDQRIKKIVDRSSAAKDLETVMKLKVTDYQMKAQVMKGNPIHKGLIAQEVEKVIPEAVLKSTAFVPDIFGAAKGAKYDAVSKSLEITMANPHHLAVGDLVMIQNKDLNRDESHQLKVTKVTNETTFVLGDLPVEIKKPFVFGKQVEDFRSVDYNRIYTTGIGAIQQLKTEKDAEVQALKEANEALKSRVATLEAESKARAEADETILTRLAAVEKLLKEADKPAAQPASIKNNTAAAE